MVARLLDEAGNDAGEARLSYVHATTDGRHNADRLQEGERLLVRAGLLDELDGRLIPGRGLGVLCSLPMGEAVEVILLLLGASLATTGISSTADSNDDLAAYMGEDSSQRRALVGALGEEHVEASCRSELDELGRPDLARQVVRVSDLSDSLGYDVFAPTVAGHGRKLEVKTQTGPVKHFFRFFLSRNEYEVGLKNRNWALVCCEKVGTSIRILGWCHAAALSARLPSDGSGRWTEAMVQMPIEVLREGIPDII